MKKFDLLKALLSANTLGFIITGLFTWTALQYYVAHGKDPEKLSLVDQVLLMAHQKSIDIRLKLRGEQAGSEQVAILTVDEKAVETVGRWPWPREVTAKAIQNAVDYGAKVIAFDIVFSEPSAQPVKTALNEVKNSHSLPSEIESAFLQQIESHDGDKKMAEIFAKINSHLVLGSFGYGDYSVTQRNFDYCANLLFQQSSQYEQWISKEKSTIITVGGPPQIPQILQEFYTKHLNDIRQSTIEAALESGQNDAYQLNSEAANRQFEFCLRFLDPKEDETYETLNENWAAIASAEGEDFLNKFPDFSSWVQMMTERSQVYAIKAFSSWTMNLKTLTDTEQTYNTGYFNAELDGDGSVRRSTLLRRTGHTIMPSIALKAYLLATQQNAQVRFQENPYDRLHEVASLELLNEDGDLNGTIPVDKKGRLLINYSGKQKIFPHFSLSDMLSDNPEITYYARVKNKKGEFEEVSRTAPKKDILKDKILVLGATAVGIYDLRVTPFEENFPGVETHANVIDNLLRKDFITAPSWEESTMVYTLVGLGVLLTLALTHLGAVAGLSLVTLLLLAIIFGDRYLLFGHGHVVSIILPLGLVLTLFLFLISYKYFTEERRKKELRSTFSKYVSPAIVDEILSDPSKIELGGRKAKVTIFFSDVRGFTTISEKLDPKELSDLLNSYLTPMTDLVFQTRGTLDKYMGDAIMAFFGAPLPTPEHAKDACRCALAHLKKLDELRKEFKARNLPDIDIGIGLNTGEVSVGNMGSQTVRSYTVMGDAVNLASRLEGINKQYGTRIIISEFTYQEVKDSFLCREIDRVRVKGKAQPVKIYELIKEGTTIAPSENWVEHFNEGYRLYHLKKWSEAANSFKKANEMRPNDEASQLYIERCENYAFNPPPADWDGVFVMTTK